MDVSLECVSVHHMYAWPPQKLDEVIDSPGTGIPNGYKPLKVSPLEEQVLVTAEPLL